MALVGMDKDMSLMGGASGTQNVDQTTKRTILLLHGGPQRSTDSSLWFSETQPSSSNSLLTTGFVRQRSGQPIYSLGVLQEEEGNTVSITIHLHFHKQKAWIIGTSFSETRIKEWEQMYK